MHVRSHGLEEACKIARLEYSNILETHKLAQEQNIQCESRPCCTVDIIYDEYAFRSGTAAVEMIRKSLDASDGAADYAIYNSEETASKFLTPGAVGSFRYPAGSISAYKFTIGLLKICLSKGLSLYTNTAAHSVEAIHAPPPGGSRYQVLTPERAISTNHIIFATNGYTAHLIPQLQGKIVPLRGQVTAQKPGPRLQERKPGGLETTYSFIYSTGYEYMIPRPSLPLVPPDGIGDIIIGGGLGRLPQEGLGEYGNTDDTVLNSENSAYLKETLKTYFAENWGDDNPMYRVKKEWTGIMGITGDGVPFVGEVPGMKGCWISAGFNGHGTLFPVSFLIFRPAGRYKGLIQGIGMVLCLKCAEALTHMVVGDDESEYTWFPESFRITEKRLNEVIFEGRKGMKAPEVAMAKA